MKKKIILCALAVSLLCNAGCYNTVQLSREEFTMETLGDLRVVTKDGKKYEFAEGQYKVLGDSLYPIGAMKIGAQKFIINTRYSGAIALSDIVTMETKELDTWKTIQVVGLVVLIGLAVAGLGWRSR